MAQGTATALTVGGRTWGRDFGDPVGEHLAVRAGCGLWDASSLRRYELRGPGAGLALDRFATNELAGLARGRLRYSVFCDDDGAVLGDGIAMRFADELYGLVLRFPADADALAAAAGDADHELLDVTDRTPHLALQGPRSRTLLEQLTGADLSGLRYFGLLGEPLRIDGAPVWVARCGYTGELGYELFTEPPHAAALVDALADAGARPYGLTAMDTLRQEAGLILAGHDFEPGACDPYELGVGRVVRLEKPEFRGRDALIERAARGPARRLTTLVCDGGEVPERGSAVLVGGRPAGEVRSSCFAPTIGRPIALALVDVDAIEAGTPASAGGVAARVAGLPVYDPGKLRPRS